jgi:hemoglobin
MTEEEKKYSDEQLYKMVFAVNEAFYETLYEHPWLKTIFEVIKQEIITTQQTDFIVGALGGPRKYAGRSPKDAHPHIFINEEMWDERERILKESFAKTSFPDDLANKWIKIDNSFKSAILMKSPDECKKRYNSDKIIYVPNPFKKAG